MAPTTPHSPLTLIELLQARLDASLEEIGAKTVYGVLDFADARKSLQTPCVAVMTLANDFGENLAPDVDEAVVQRDTTTVAVICVVSAANDLGGRKGTTEDKLSPMLEATRSVLLGWSPAGEFIGRQVVRRDAATRALFGPTTAELQAPPARWRPLMLRRGRLVAINDGSGRAWWQDEYTTFRLIHGAPSVEDPGATPDTLCVSTQGDAPVLLEEVA